MLMITGTGINSLQYYSQHRKSLRCWLPLELLQSESTACISISYQGKKKYSMTTKLYISALMKKHNATLSQQHKIVFGVCYARGVENMNLLPFLEERKEGDITPLALCTSPFPAGTYIHASFHSRVSQTTMLYLFHFLYPTP